MKVLIVTPFYPFPENNNGVNKIVVNLIKHNRYYNADVLSLYNLQDERFFSCEKNFESNFYKIPNKTLSKKKTIFRWLVNKYPYNVTRQTENFQEIKKIIEKIHLKYDVIHFVTPFLFPLLEKLDNKILKKIILFPIDSFSYFTFNRIKHADLLLKFPLYYDFIKWKNFEKKFYINFPHRIYFVSNKDCEFVKKLHPKIEAGFIPNGVDTNYFKPTKTVCEKNSIIFTGNMSYAPNKDAVKFLLYEVLPIVKKEIPDIRVYIVGLNAEKEFNKIIMKNVFIKGYVEDLREWLEKAEIFVSPLRFGSGIKNKVLEAMAMEKIVIGTDISFEGIKGENVFIRSTSNPVDFANKIVFALNQKPKYIEKNARKLVEESYSWEHIRMQYAVLYKKVKDEKYSDFGR